MDLELFLFIGAWGILFIFLAIVMERQTHKKLYSVFAQHKTNVIYLTERGQRKIFEPEPDSKVIEISASDLIDSEGFYRKIMLKSGINNLPCRIELKNGKFSGTSFEEKTVGYKAANLKQILST